MKLYAIKSRTDGFLGTHFWNKDLCIKNLYKNLNKVKENIKKYSLKNVEILEFELNETKYKVIE